MIARGFRPVGWVAAVAAAALGCYMLSLNVAAEKADLTRLERQIIAAKQDIRTLQTELGTRGRMSQLEHWNAEILALSAPSANQYLENELMLARFDRRPKTIEDRARVQLASAESVAKPEVRLAPRDFAIAVAMSPPAPTPLVRQASLVAMPAQRPLLRSVATAVLDAQPDLLAVKQASVSKVGLIDADLSRTIDAAARAERKKGGAGAQ